jgi:outer membrane receptor protein involved in Fe transport
VKSLIGISLFFLFALKLQGQNPSIFVFDQNSGKPLSYSSFLARETGGKKSISGIVDQEGRIDLQDLQFPIEIKVIHVNHLRFSGILNSADTIFPPEKNNLLNEVVVTGQYEPEPLKNSLIKVKTIGPAEMENRGATSLAQALQYQVNYSLEPDPATGTVGLSIQGLDSRQVKVLLDGVPLSGRTGNSVDLSQINISNVERIELVEGPLAVQYGTDAMAGVINIISKNPSGQKPFLRLDIQEETVGESYGTNEGIHQQNIFFGTGFAKDFYTQFELGYRYFGGFQGGLEGREKLWDPKRNITGNFKLGFRPKSAKLEYRFDYFDEKIDSKASAQGILNPIALDEVYKTRRMIHQLNGYYSLKNSKKLDWVISYTDYERIKNQYVNQLTTGEKVLSQAEGAQDTAVIYAYLFRGIFSGKPSERFSYQLGVDFNHEKGQGGRILGNDLKELGDFAGFASLQYSFSSRFSSRLGLRYAYNSNYQGPPLPSLHLKYKLLPNLDIRFSYGRGFRAPALKELYFIFYDASHRLRGNESLEPEYSHHFDLGFSHKIELSGEKFLVSDLTIFFNDLSNQITFGQDLNDPTITTYINAKRYRTLGFSLNESVGFKHWEIGAGIGVTGRYNEFSDSIRLDKYLFSPEINTSVSYHPELWGLSFSLFYKFTGAVPQYTLGQDDNGNPEVLLGKRKGFHWADFSVTKKFPKAVSLVLGVKNILDVTSVDQVSEGGATHATGNQLPIGYGRSYFFRLIFQINNN